MKKIFVILTAFGLLCNVALFASSQVAHSNFLTVLHPETWGLDGLIKGVLTVAVSYVIGLFTKSPSFKRKRNN